MYANQNNVPGYVEMFDVERFEQIARDVECGKGTNGNYSDMECYLHSIMKRLLEAEK